MNNDSKLTRAAQALIFSALMSAAAHAQTAPNFVRPRNPVTEQAVPPAPKVALVGDWITYYWSGTPANWTNDAVLGVYGMGSGISVQSAIAQKPAIIHIMVGTVDAFTYYDSTFNLVSQDFLSGLNTAIEQAKAAGIQVILGIEPSALCSNSGELEVLDSVVASLAAKYNLPVVDYDGAFGPFNGNSNGLITAPPTVSAPAGDDYYINANPTPAGYALMTQMLQTAISTMGATVKSGYLQNVEQANESSGYVPVTNANTVMAGVTVNFTPIAAYSNGLTEQVMYNTNIIGANGTWTSSNPLVGYVTQSGQFWAISQGTAIVKYTAPNGVQFSEWIMYVTQGTE